MVWDIYIFIFVAIAFMILISRRSFYIEKVQELNIEKEFKTKRHRFYEKCSVCGKQLNHARVGKTGDVMICTVECRGKTTWYCEECGERYIDNAPSIPPEDYI